MFCDSKEKRFVKRGSQLIKKELDIANFVVLQRMVRVSIKQFVSKFGPDTSLSSYSMLKKKVQTFDATPAFPDETQSSTSDDSVFEPSKSSQHIFGANGIYSRQIGAPN